MMSTGTIYIVSELHRHAIRIGDEYSEKHLEMKFTIQLKKSKIFIAVSIQIVVFWVVTPFSLFSGSKLWTNT
jgi:hypothetical protein